MGSGLFPMAVTVAGAVYVYYLLSVKMGFSETAAMVSGVLTAIILAAFFTRLKGGKGKKN